VVQLLASVLGGYLAGRLRSRWVTVHTHEVYFRDTAHGFLAWSVATLLMATLLSSAVGGIVTTGVKATGAVAEAVVATGGAAAAGMASTKSDDSGSDSVSYSVDSLFRASAPGATPTGAPNAAQPASPNRGVEVTRIFANGLKSGELGTADTQYLGQLVAQSTGLSQADAERRVADTFTQLKQTLQTARDNAKKAADEARTASAYLALWLVISLLMGAFVASFAATFGGRLRDSSVLATA